MPPLESQESAGEKKEQSAKGLNILTPEQMLTRLPISLALLQAGTTLKNLKTKQGNYYICTDQKR